MYGHGLNTAKAILKQKTSTNSLQSAASSGSIATRQSDSDPSSSDFKEIDLAKTEANAKLQVVYLHGWRLYVLTFAFVTECLRISNPNLTLNRLCLSLFLSTLEITIVSTSLVSISDALQGFQKDSWIVSSYLLTYTGENCVPDLE